MTVTLGGGPEDCRARVSPRTPRRYARSSPPVRSAGGRQPAGPALCTGPAACPPFPLDTATGQHQRRFGLIRFLDWLEAQPGWTWQERWDASGVTPAGGPTPREERSRAWLKTTGRISPSNTTAHMTLGAGLLELICGDVIRPSVSWLLTTTSRRTGGEMARVRDPAGFAALTAASQAAVVGGVTARGALDRIAVIMAAKGGSVRDITVGDCLELLEIADVRRDQRRTGRGPTSTSCCTLSAYSRRRPAHRADVQRLPPRAAHPGPADRPLRPGLPPGPRPAGGLPARAAARTGLHQLGRAGDPSGLLFWKDLETPSWHRLAEP